MKEFKSEFAHSYGTYSFGYCNYAILEKGDSLSLVYEKGYLPYSGDEKARNVFYMARSARVPLGEFKMSSENRRVAKKFDGMFEREYVPVKHFDTNNEEFLDFCLSYFKKRHGKNAMPEKRLRTILGVGLISDIVVYKKDDVPLAYVFLVQDKHTTHFWFSFYDLSLVHQSLGMWLMIDIAREAQKQKKLYFYLGTVYAEKALYKTNFEKIEYWNGTRWIQDKKKLRARSRGDKSREVLFNDEWKDTFK
jgi:leucyl-tRNA---protein transferase